MNTIRNEQISQFSQMQFNVAYNVNNKTIMITDKGVNKYSQTTYSGVIDNEEFRELASVALNKILNIDSLKNYAVLRKVDEQTNQQNEQKNDLTSRTTAAPNNANVEDALKVLANAFSMPQKVDSSEILEKCREMIDETIKNSNNFVKSIKINDLQEVEIGGILHDKFETVVKLVKIGTPVYLHGEAGTGKNILCEQVAKSLGINFYYAGSLQQKYELEGFIDASGTYQETEFYKAFTNGGLFMFDEIDGTAAEVLIAFNACMSNNYYNFPKHGRTIAHKNFRIVAAGNTTGRGATNAYNGRYQLDASTLDRFAFVKLDYNDKILLANANNNLELVEFSKELREAITECRLTYTVSPRGLKRYTDGLQLGIDENELMKISFCGGWSDRDIDLLKQKLHSSNKYSLIFINM